MGEFHDLPRADRIQRYRDLADRADADAQRMPYGDARADLLLIAGNWRRLADDTEAMEERLRVFVRRDPIVNNEDRPERR